MPARNRAGVILRALTSIESQLAAPAAVIVVDDGSTDDTAAIAREWGAEVLQSGGCGSGSARNMGIRAAGTELVAFLDSDDEWLPQHLATCLSGFADNAMVSSYARDSHGIVRGLLSAHPIDLTPRRCFIPENPVVTSTVVARRSALCDAGLFGDFARAQDVHMWARVLERGAGRVIPEVTATYHDERVATAALEAVTRDSTWLIAVLDDLSDRPWMTPSLRVAVQTRIEWDAFRGAYREGQWRNASAHLGWLFQTPASWPRLADVLLARRRARAHS